MAQFPLKMNGAEVCTLEDLKKNFNPADLVSYRNRFAAWLKGWDYDEEAVAVKALDPELVDEEWLFSVCEIIGISDEELKASWKKMEEAAKQEEEKVSAKLEERSREKRLRSVDRLKISPFTEQVAPWENEDPEDLMSVSICDEKIFILFGSADKISMYVSDNGKDYKYINRTDGNLEDVGLGQDMILSPVYSMNNLYIYLGTCNIYYSSDGYHWEQRETPIVSYDSQTGSSLVYTGTKYVLFGGDNEIAISDSLDDDWEVHSLGFDLQGLSSLVFHKGRLYIKTWDDDCNDVVYSSENAIDWRKMKSSADTGFIDEAELRARRACGRKVFFDLENDTEIIASTEIDDSYEKVADCPFETAKILAYENKLLLFGKNLEYATATYKFE